MIVRREHFTTPERLQPMWTLTKDRRAAICEVWSHELGYELRLMVGVDTMPRTQVCRSTEDIVTLQETWRLALEQAGWASVNPLDIPTTE